MKKSLIFSALAVALAAFTASAETKTVEVNAYTGKAAMDWSARVSKWTSNADIVPSVVISSPNNLTASGTNVTLNANSNGDPYDITVTPADGWYVTNIAGGLNSMSGCTLTVDGQSIEHKSGASVNFSGDVTPALEPLVIGVNLPAFGNATLSNLVLTLSNDPISTVEPEPTMPEAGVYYRLSTRYNGDHTQFRYGSCMELLSSGANAGKIFCAKPVEADADNYGYQWFTFEADPEGSGYYALVCFAQPAGSVNITPTATDNNARWTYDNAAKHYGFYLVEKVGNNSTQGIDEEGVFYSAITSTNAAAGWYMNAAAGGQEWSINLYQTPTDQNAGLFLFEPMPEVVEPVDPDAIVFDVLNSNGTFNRSGYACNWTSDATEPQLTLHVTNSESGADLNNINSSLTEGGLQIHACHNTSFAGALVTLTTDEGYYVSGFSFTGVCTAGKNNTVTIGEAVFTLTTTGEKVTATFSHDEVASFLLGGDFAPITFNDFTVTVAKAPESPVDPVDPDEKYYESLSRTLWTADVSSQTEDGSLTQYGPQVGFDDNVSTFWGSSWAHAGGFDNSQVYHVDLGETVEFDGFDYTGRQAGNSLDILGQYEIYVTDEALTREQTSEYFATYGFEGHTPVAEGTMEDSRATQRVIFDAPVSGRHFYIRALSATNGKGGSSNVFTVAELNLIREVSDPEFAYWTEPITGTKFNSDGKWSIKSFCCEETSGEGSNNGKIEYLIDDNANSYYHSNWMNTNYKGSHGFIIDFGETVTAEGLAWIPRQNAGSNNGRWTKYRVWFYENEEDLPTLEAHQGYEDFITGTPDAEGTLTALAGDPVETSVFPEPLTGRYMLVIPTGNLGFSCAAEVGIATVIGEETKSALRSELVKPYVARVENLRNALPGINEVLDGILSSIEEASATEVHGVCMDVEENLTSAVTKLVAGYVENGTLLTIKNVRRNQYLAVVPAPQATEENPEENTEENADENTPAYVANTVKYPTPNAVWKLDACDATSFFLTNYESGLTVGADQNDVDMVEQNGENCYAFTFAFSGNGIVSIPFAGTPSLGLNVDSGTNNLTYFNYTDAGSQWIIEFADDNTYDMNGDTSIQWDNVQDLGFMAVSTAGLSSFTITFPAAAETTGYGYAYVLGTDNDPVAELNAADFIFNEDKTVATYTLAEPIIEDGSYAVMISDGFFYLNDGEKAGISPVIISGAVFVAYVPDTEFDVIVTPAAGEYKTIDNVTITLDGVDDFTINNDVDGIITISKDSEVVKTVNSTDFTNEEIDGVTYFNWVVDITEEGEYTLDIPAHYFISNSGYNKAFSVTWKVLGKQDGISEISADADSVVVFDIQGRRMPKAVRGAVNIINGQKVIR